MPLRADVTLTSDISEASKGVDFAVLLASTKLRDDMVHDNMGRKDMLTANAKIFKLQGQALNKFAHRNVKVQLCVV